MLNVVRYVKQNFLLVSGAALLAGTCWFAFAVTYALFRDTTGPTIMAARAAYVPTESRSLSQEQAEADKDGYIFWFRQRTSLQPTPIEQAQIDHSVNRIDWSEPNQ